MSQAQPARPLAEKVAIVTGATGGLGQHIVAAMLAQGVAVAALSRSASGEVSDSHLPLRCDLAERGAAEHAVSATTSHFGRLDFIVNNAAIFHPMDFGYATPEMIESHMAINFMGALWLTRAAIPQLVQNRGHIVSISSEAVSTAVPMMSVYAASKAALETLTWSLGEEYRDAGVRSTVLRSGYIRSSGSNPSWDIDTATRFMEKLKTASHAQRLGQGITPESLAEIIVKVLQLPADVAMPRLDVLPA